MVEDRRKATIRLSGSRSSSRRCFRVLAVSFWVLQVVQHAKFEELAENNHQRTLALRAPRGLVFDRDGRVMVENRHSYSISIVREHTKDLNRTDPQCWPPCSASTKPACAPSSTVTARADVSADHDHPGRLAGAGRGRRRRAVSTSSCPTSSSSRCRRGAIRRRWARTCSGTSARSATRRWPKTARSRAATSPASRAWRRSTTRTSWARTAPGASSSTASDAKSARSKKIRRPRASGCS